MNLQSDRKLVTVRIEKPTRVKAPGGGKEETFAPIAGKWKATQNFYSKVSLARLEEAAHGAQGPGVETQAKQLFVFWGARPTLLRDYRIVDPNGMKWRVLFIRSYDESLQVDTEIVA